MNPGKVIFLTSESPFPPVGGSRLRDLLLARLIGESLPVEILCFDSPRGRSGMGDSMADVRVTLIAREAQPLWRRAAQVFRPSPLPAYSAMMERALRARAQPGAILWVSRMSMAQYIPLAKSLGYKIILDEHHVESGEKMDHASSSPRHWAEAIAAVQCAWYESRYCQDSHAVVAASDIAACRLQKLVPRSKIEVIPSAVDSQALEEIRACRGSTLLFSGLLDRRENHEGVSWFLREVLPRLRATLRENTPRVVVAGAHPSAALVELLNQSGVELHANPTTLAPHLSEAAVVVVPIRSGDGAHLRILEAMAAGRPVVTTGRGAEGLVLSPTYDVFIADGPDAFTSAIVRLLRDPELQRETGRRAVETITKRYDWRVSKPRLQFLLEKVARE